MFKNYKTENKFFKILLKNTIKCSHNNAAFLRARLRKLLPATTATEAPPPGRSEEEKRRRASERGDRHGNAPQKP